MLNWLGNVSQCTLNYSKSSVFCFAVEFCLGIRLGSAYVYYNKTTSKLWLTSSKIWFVKSMYFNSNHANDTSQNVYHHNSIKNCFLTLVLQFWTLYPLLHFRTKFACREILMVPPNLSTSLEECPLETVYKAELMYVTRQHLAIAC